MSGDGLEDGQRVGRYLVIRDVDARLHAICAGAVAAVTEAEHCSVLMLPGGRLLQVPGPMERMLGWLEVR